MVIDNAKVMRALSASTAVLLGSENVGLAVQTMLAKIGKELAIHSAFVFIESNQKLSDPDNALLYLWCDPSKAQPLSYRAISMAAFLNYRKFAGNNGAFVQNAGEVAALSDSILRRELVDAGIQSFLHFPILVNQQLRGVLGLHCARGIAGFDKDQQEAIGQIASLVGMRLKHDASFNEISTLRLGLEMAIDNASDIILIFNEFGKATYISSAIERILGYKVTALEGKELAEFIHVGDASNLREAEIINRLKEGHSTNLRFRAKHFDGHWVWLESSVRVLPNDLNSFQGYVAIARVLDESFLSNDLHDKSDNAASLGELDKQFMSLTDHQLKNPLTVIYNNAELLEMLSLDDPAKRYISRIKGQVTHLVDLMNGLLLHGRTEKNQMAAPRTHIDVKKWATELLKTYFMRQRDGRILNLELPKDDVFLVINELVLQNIFVNLIDNALKFSENCKAPTWRIKKLEKGVLFEVEDWGIGIPAKDQDQVYQLYFRASNVGAIAGTGLGLAAAKRLITDLGGSISYVTRVNAGTTFSIYLPNL